MKAMKRLIVGVWRSGEWPEQWMISELVLLLKVTGTHNEFTYTKNAKQTLTIKI